MKKRSFYSFFVAGMIMLATGSFVSCEEDMTNQVTTIPITIVPDNSEFVDGTVARTRGTKVTAISGLGISASVYSAASTYTSAGCGSFFFNESVTAGTPTAHYWPTSDYRLSFFGYYPYGNAALTVQSAASATGAPTYAYTVPSAIASQLDVMTGQTTDVLGGGNSPVSMTMKHRCAAIRFSVTNSRSSAITLTSISIEGVKYTGTLNEDTWTLSSSVNSSSSNPFTLSYGSTIAANATADVTGTTNIFLMLPQAIPVGAKVKAVVDGDEFEAAIDGSWVAGKQYNYSIEVTNSTIIVVDGESDIEDWADIWLSSYLTFTAEETGTFSFIIDSSVSSSDIKEVSYSLDEGETWVRTAYIRNGLTITTPEVTAGNTVLWKGIGTRCDNSSFSATGKFSVSGNIMSLLYGDDFENKVSLQGTRAFAKLFYRNQKITSAENLMLPATTLLGADYYEMFCLCTSLTSAPKLPATTLASGCYQNMFTCTALTSVPALPTTTLAPMCYSYMFSEIETLTSVPDDLLPATTLTIYCYKSMFYHCTNLTNAPILPAATLVERCYYQMFEECTNLHSITMLATDISESTALLRWVYNVPNNGTFTKASSMTSLPEGRDGIPTGWTVLNYE